jgi:ribosomal protein S18 acetylase RimI-like enzyme
MPHAATDLHAKRLIDFTSAAAADIFTACFEGYIVPLRFQAEPFERRNRSEHVDAEASLIWYRGQQPVGGILIARRGWTSRVSAMGVVAAARGTGVGRHMVEEALEAARERKDRRMLLEVIEQNPPAIALYESAGFRKARRLVGYVLPAAQTNDTGRLEDCDALEAARFIGAEGERDLPWMLSVETLSGLASPTRAFRLGPAVALVNEMPEAVVIRALAVARTERRKGHGKALVSALSCHFSGKPLKIISIVPETLAPDFFATCGLKPESISQFEMEAII